MITGYYNRENLVDESIQSLIDQSYENIEIIIFDDCSTDNTYKELKKFDFHPKVKLIRHEKNKGFTQGLIDAIEISSGEYIAIHGSGDISLKERIAKQVRFLEKNENYDLVAPRFERIDEVSNESIELSNYSGELTVKDFLKKSRFTHGSVMFRKETYDKVGGYEPTFIWVQDMDLFTRMLREGQGYVLNKVLYKQFTREDGVSVNPSKLFLQAKYAVLRRYIAKNNTERAEILKEVNRVGVEKYIKNDNSHFQKIIYQKCIKLINLGRYHEYKKVKESLIIKKLKISKKINLNFYDNVYLFLIKISVKKIYIIVLFKLIKSAKNFVAKLIYKTKNKINEAK